MECGVIAEIFLVNACFPLLRHLHFAAVIEEIVAQFLIAENARNIGIKICIVGVVDKPVKAFRLEIAVHNSVQFFKLLCCHFFKPCGKEIYLVKVAVPYPVKGYLNVPVLVRGIAVQEKIMRVIGCDVQCFHGFVEFFFCGRQGEEHARRVAFFKLGAVLYQHGKIIFHKQSSFRCFHHFKRVWDTSQQAKFPQVPPGGEVGIYGIGYSIPMLAILLCVTSWVLASLSALTRSCN